MKVLFLFLFVLTTVSSAQDSIQVFTRVTDDVIEKNLVKGIETDNLGLKVSASYYLGERGSEKAVLPLMNILHTDKSIEARIMAALSLFKIGNEKGMYAVKRAIKFDESQQVRRMCEIFYTMYMTEHPNAKITEK